MRTMTSIQNVSREAFAKSSLSAEPVSFTPYRQEFTNEEYIQGLLSAFLRNQGTVAYNGKIGDKYYSTDILNIDSKPPHFHLSISERSTLESRPSEIKRSFHVTYDGKITEASEIKFTPACDPKNSTSSYREITDPQEKHFLVMEALRIVSDLCAHKDTSNSVIEDRISDLTRFSFSYRQK